VIDWGDMKSSWPALFVVAAACGGGSPDPNPAVDGATADGAPLADATNPDGPVPPADAAPGDGPAPDGGSPACGNAHADVTPIEGTEGIAIAADGTIYYSQDGAVGRLLPDGTRDDRWAVLDGPDGGNTPDVGTVWGLALTGTHLYAASPDSNSIWKVSLSGSQVENWVEVADGSPNGLILGADGLLYVSAFSQGQIFRVDPMQAHPQAIRVTDQNADGLDQPNGLYSVDASHLVAIDYADGDVWELTLANGQETNRTRRTRITNGNLDGITRDAQGRWYFTDQRGRRVVQRPADLSAPGGAEHTVGGTISSPANLEFGRGALSCQDLYVTSGRAMARIVIDN